MSSRLLINESPLVVQPSLAKLLGLNEAIFLQQVHYWLNPDFNKNLKDGKYWVHNTYAQWKTQFPFWGEKTIRRIVSNLEKKSILISRQGKNEFNNPKFYSIDYIALDNEPSKKTAENIGAEIGGQSDQVDLVNVTSSYNKDTETTLLHQEGDQDQSFFINKDLKINHKKYYAKNTFDNCVSCILIVLPTIIKRFLPNIQAKQLDFIIGKSTNRGLHVILRQTFAIFFLGLFLSSYEVQGSSEIARKQDQILGNEAQRQREVLDTFRKVTPPAQTKVEVEERLKKPVEGAPTVRFGEIVLEGADLLIEGQKKSLTQKYLDKDISFEEINELLRAVTNFYVGQGYITTRAYLKPQNIKDGSLTVSVLEGKVGSLHLSENGKRRGYFPGNFAVDLEAPLNIRDLEQAVDQINRLPSHQAFINLEPGAETRQSVVNIDTQTTTPVRMSLSLDNYGSEQTGLHVVETSLGVDDVLGLYDMWFLSVRATKDFDDRWKRSRSVSFVQSLPFGYWTARFSMNLFDYISKVEGQLQKFRFSGIGQTYGGELERIVHRDSAGKTGISGGLSYKDTRSFIEGVLIETSTYRLVVADFRAFHVRRFLGGSLNASVTYSQGTRFMGATKDESSGGRDLKAQFSKYTGVLGFYRPFTVLAQNFGISFQGQIQTSPHDLYSSERVSLGGKGTVRGFKESKIGGDTGGHLQNEFLWTVNQSESGVFRDVLGTVQAFAAYDMGWIHKDKTDPFEKGTLTGAAVGIRASGGLVFGEAVISRAISMPSFVTPEGTLFAFKLGTNF